MYLWQSSFLLLFEAVLAVGSTSAQSCLPHAPTPLAIPIRNVTMQGSNSVRRGAAISFGSPPQTLAFEISPYVINRCFWISKVTDVASRDTNDTMLFDATNNTCQLHPGAFHTKPIATAVQCFSYYGGLFDKTKSSSWTSADSAAALGLISPVTQLESDGNFSYGVDKVELGAGFNDLSGYPLVLSPGTSTTEGFSQNAIGVGSNSTLLNELAATGQLPSNVWSIYDGWTGATSQNQSDGTFVFGGYDAAKTTGENTTFKFRKDPTSSHDAGWAVTIKDMQLQFTNGSRSSLFAPDEVSACIFHVTPSYPYISIGDQIWSNFLDMSGSTQVSRSYSPLSWWQEVIAAKTAYTGDLILTLDTGFQITIPSHELVKPYVDIDENGVEYILNSSTVRVTAFYSLGTGYGCGLLGRPFLSSAYMMVDNDQEQLTLWQGQPSQEQKLVAVGSPKICTASAPASPVTPTAGPATSAVNATAPAISKGAVAGIIAAVSSVTIACVAIGIYYLVQRQAKQQRGSIHSKASQSSNLDPHTTVFPKPELSSDHDHLPRQELGNSGRNHSDGIPPYEMSGTHTWTTHELPEQSHPAFEMVGEYR